MVEDVMEDKSVSIPLVLLSVRLLITIRKRICGRGDESCTERHEAVLFRYDVRPVWSVVTTTWGGIEVSGRCER